MTHPEPDPLPGLDVPTRSDPTRLEVAIRRTIGALNKAQHVDEADAARLELALTMERVITLKISSGRMSTIGNDARVLMELLDKIVSDASAVDDDLEAAMAEWTDEFAPPADEFAPPADQPAEPS